MPLEFDGVNGIVKNTTSDGDVTIKGNDDGSEISAVIFDMSTAGKATFNNDIALGDSQKAVFGASEDLQIFHDGSNSYVDDTGTGRLILRGNDRVMLQKYTGEDMVTCIADGAVNIYHNNAKKFETTAAGITVTGTATVVDDISISGSTPSITLTDTDDNSDCMVYQAAGNLYLEADKNSEASGSFLRIAVDDLDMVHVYNGETVFNESSRDQNFRIESDGNANMFKLDAGNNAIGIGSDPISNSMLHIKQAASGQSSVAANAEEFIVEDDDNCGMTILSGTGNTGTICFGDSGDDNIGQLQYHHAEDSFKIITNTAERFRITDGGKVGIFETSPDCSDGGITINQGTGDSNILTFKSSDVAHARTHIAETDTYAEFGKASGNDGGLVITSLNDAGNIAFYMDAHARTNDTGKGTGDHGIMNFDANKHDGSGGGESLLSNANMVTFSNDNSVRFIFDAEGDLHADASLNASAFDTYEDAQLVRAYDLSHGKSVIASKFDDFVQYNKDDLTDAGLVGKVNHEYNKDGTKAAPLINMSGFMRLHNGAIWQQYEKHQKLASAFYKLAEKTIGKEEADKLLTEEEIQLLN